MSKQIALVIEPDGATRHLVDEVSERLGNMIGPKLSTRRASHVESWGDLSKEAQVWVLGDGVDDAEAHVDVNDFWADLLPVGGPVLGPFPLYSEAIDAEITWLQEHNLPTAE